MKTLSLAIFSIILLLFRGFAPQVVKCIAMILWGPKNCQMSNVNYVMRPSLILESPLASYSLFQKPHSYRLIYYLQDLALTACFTDSTLQQHQACYQSHYILCMQKFHK